MKARQRTRDIYRDRSVRQTTGMVSWKTVFVIDSELPYCPILARLCPYLHSWDLDRVRGQWVPYVLTPADVTLKQVDFRRSDMGWKNTLVLTTTGSHLAYCSTGLMQPRCGQPLQKVPGR